MAPVSEPSDAQQPGSQGSAGSQPPPSQRVDPLGSWITAGLIGAIFFLFYLEARELPSDIQRWPMWLISAGSVLLAVYAFQQAALKREWKVVEKVDELTELGEDAELGVVAAAKAEAAEATREEEEENLRDTTQYGSAEDYSRHGDWMTAWASLGFVIFAALAYGFGWLPAAMLFVPTYMYFNGERHAGKLIGLSLGTGLSIYLLFGSILNTPMTRGEWYRTDWLIDWIPF